MSASTPVRGGAAAENELLARLGLPPSASPEDVDLLHLHASQFLASAPPAIRGWARAQAAALDETYLSLTDPVGLEGAALSSPTRPPTVVPGGPATPPARRDPVPAVESPAVESPAAAVAQEATQEAAAALAPAADVTGASPEEPGGDDTDTDDLDALYASVTPGAHRDLVSGGRPDRAAAPATAPATAPAPVAAQSAPAARPEPARRAKAGPAPVQAAPPPAAAGPWKGVAILASSALAVALAVFVIGPLVFGMGAVGGTAATGSPAASSTLDMAQVGALMQKIAADPKDTASLQALGDLYYTSGDYASAGSFYDKLLAVDPKNVKGLLARGAAYFNGGDIVKAKAAWDAVVAIDPKNVEAHYDLGFLAMNQTPADWAAVQREWQMVIAADPNSSVAKTVQQHLDALAKASMLPAASAAAPSASPASPAPLGSPAASGAAAGSPAAAPAAVVVNETAQNMAFTATSLTAPANTPFTIHYSNLDADIPHDIVIRDASGATVFTGDMITGPATADYRVPALAAGSYTFVCSIHAATMAGTLAVGS